MDSIEIRPFIADWASRLGLWPEKEPSVATWVWPAFHGAVGEGLDALPALT